MKEMIRKWPISFGVVAAITISSSLMLFHLMIPAGLSDAAWRFADSALRAVLTVPCIVLLGYIIQGSGFRSAFTARGFAKGLFACAAVFLFILTPLLRFFNMSEMDVGYRSEIPSIIAQQIATGVFEEAAFRGLFMTAMLMKWNGTIKGRMASVWIAGFVFGAGHLSNLFYHEDTNAVLMNALGACILGISFSAIYLYSKNLLSCMLIHALNNIAVHLSNNLIAGALDTTLNRILDFAQPVIMYAAIPLFAVTLSIKAKPFPQPHQTG